MNDMDLYTREAQTYAKLSHPSDRWHTGRPKAPQKPREPVPKLGRDILYRF